MLHRRGGSLYYYDPEMSRVLEILIFWRNTPSADHAADAASAPLPEPEGR